MDDELTTQKGLPIGGLFAKLLANDLPDPEVLEVTSFTQPVHGSVSTGNGEGIYTPPPDFVGTDTFSYTVREGSGPPSDPATVTITITAAEGPRQSAFILLCLLAAFSLPGAASGAVFCDKDLAGVRLSDQGRVEIRVEQTGGHPLGTLLQICNIEEPMGTIDSQTCQRLYSQLLAAFHTDTPVSLHFRDAVLDQEELWEGNCESLTHQGDFSSALVTIESRK